MANKLPSALLAAQAKIAAQYQSAEVRELQNPILRKGLAAAPYLMVNLNSIRESTKRTEKGYQRVKMTATNGTARSHNFTGNQNDTQEVDISWGTYSEKFSVYWDASADNVYNSMVEDIRFGLSESMRIIRERAGKGLIAALHAGRTQVKNTTIRNAEWDAANYVMKLTDEEKMFAHMKSIMEQHKYYGSLDVMVDSVLDPKARHLFAQGDGNATNLSYQAAGIGEIMPHHALGTDVSVEADYSAGGIAIVLPQYAFAHINWIPVKYRAGLGDINQVNGKRFVQRDDTGLQIEYAVWAYTEKADGSAVGGTTDDMVTHLQVSTDFATQIQETSTAEESPIFEFALVG